MQRPIIGFALDDLGDWTALLSCGHRQHVRHNPPFANRPWVTTEAGRESRLRLPLECVRCDRLELPDAVVPYSRTPVFTERSMPDRLRANHTTAAGVWGRIVVLEGALRYHVEAFGLDVPLTPAEPGIVVPEVPHSVVPSGSVRFYVEFLCATPSGHLDTSSP
jgi:tellurite resistance-related uncharacterized protein